MHIWTLSYQYWNIVFADRTTAYSSNFAFHYGDWLQCDDEDLAQCFNLLTLGNNVAVSCKYPLRRVVNYCMEQYRYVRAAGGLVEAPDGRQLLIYRNDRWDLPKGKVEPGETLREAAAREVMEESGMHDLTVKELIRKSYHIFNLYGGWHLKQTSWFRMEVPQAWPIVVQKEEGITHGEWAEPSLCRERLTHSYATLRQIFE